MAGYGPMERAYQAQRQREQQVPTALKKNAERALKELSPAVNEIRAYHDRIRQAGTP